MKLRSLVRVGLTVAFLAVVITPSTASAATNQTTSSQGPGLTNLSACVAQTHQLDIAVMMDESGSLGFESDGVPATDPHARRVAALQELLSGLASLSVGPNAAHVEVALSGFSSQANVVRGFTAVTPATLPSLDAAAASFRDKDTGPDTDFYSALSAAKQQLAARAVQTRDSSCQALLLFTDGVFSYEVRPGVHRSYAPGLSADTSADAIALENAGKQAVCRSGGLIDQIRSDRVYPITVGLGPGASKGASFLAGLAGAGGCGTRAGLGGLYLPASSVGALLEAFDVAGAELGGGTEIGAVTGSPRAFYLGADLNHALVVARTTNTAGAVGLKVIAPDGRTAHVPTSGTVSLDGLQFVVQHRADGYVAVIAKPLSSRAGFVGTWRVQTSDRASQTVTDVIEFPDLVPTLSSAPIVYLGQHNALSIGLRRLSGAAPTTAEAAARHQLRLAIGNPASGSAPVSLAVHAGPQPGTFTSKYTVPTSGSSTSVDLILTLTSTAPGGRVLTKVVRTVALTVQPPVGYPQVRPSRLTFGSVTGSKSSTATIDILGGTAGGCVQLGSLATTATPSGVNKPTVVEPSGCLAVKPGQSLPETLRLAHQGSGSGLLTGSLGVTLVNPAGQRLVLRLPVNASFERPIHQTRRILLLLALLLGGVLLPLLIMYAIAIVAARFRPLGTLRFVHLPVDVTAGSVNPTDRPLDAGALVKFVRPVPEADRGPRRIVVPDGPIVRSSISRNPFGPAVARATHPSQDVVASGGTQQIDGRWVGILSPQLGAGWVYSIERRSRNIAAEPQLHGVLTLLCAENDSRRNPWPDAVSHAATELPSLCAPVLESMPAEANNADGLNPEPGDDEISASEPGDPPDDPRFSVDLFPSD